MGPGSKNEQEKSGAVPVKAGPPGTNVLGPPVPEEVSTKPEEASGSGQRVLPTYFSKSSLRIPDQRAQRDTLK